MELDPIQLASVAAIFVVAGAVKGVIGLGLPTLSIGLMGAWLPIEQAAAILILPAFLTNVWQMWNGDALTSLIQRLWPMLCGIVFGTVVAAGFIIGADGWLATAILGTILAAYAVFGLIGAEFRVSPGAEPVIGPLTGLATGLINGATAIFVLPALPYLQGLRLGKDELIQAIGITACVSIAALALGLGMNDSLGSDALVPGVTALLAAFAGMGLGQKVRSKLSVETFRRWIYIGLFALGCAMVVRALG